MKKIFYMLPIVMLVMSLLAACTHDDNKLPSNGDPTKTYEVTNDVQLLMSTFLNSLPEE